MAGLRRYHPAPLRDMTKDEAKSLIDSLVSAPVKPRIKRPIPKKLLTLPPKTITTKPELLPPFTTIAINPTEEVIDLTELTSYGRYAIITQNDNHKKQFLVSDNCSSAEEMENPAYAVYVERNRKIEKENEAAIESYRESVKQYRDIHKEGVLLPDVKGWDAAVVREAKAYRAKKMFRSLSIIPGKKAQQEEEGYRWVQREDGGWTWTEKTAVLVDHFRMFKGTNSDEGDDNDQ
jgi:flagellar biosynthesis regulator FlbT